MRRVLLAVVVMLLSAAGAKADTPGLSSKYLFAQPNASAPPAIKGHVLHVGEPVKDEYLVFLVDGDRREIPAMAASLARAHGGRLIQVWNDGVQGFWVSMNANQAEAMLHNPHVRSVEENAVLHDSGTQAVGGSDPFWHLDRIDQRSPLLNNSFQYCSGATQVYAYVFDRGVRSADPQLNGRVIPGKNASPADSVCPNNMAPDQPAPYADGGSFDERNPCGEHNVLNVGHGTAVATVLAGSSVGVSKTTIVVPLRIRNCQSVQNPDYSEGDPNHPPTDVANTGAWIDAFDWLFGSSNTLWDSTNQRSRYPAVANFSIWFLLAAPNSPECEAEKRLQQLIRGGVVAVASANNDNKDVADLAAQTKAPARLSYSNPLTMDDHNQPLFADPERVITVGGTMLSNGVDQRWVCPPLPSGATDPACGGAGSNFGLGVDIWAPAHDIQSGHITSLSPGTGDPWIGPQYRRPFTFGLADRDPLPITTCTPSTQNARTGYARSGTSFSAPIVAGAAARLLAEDPSLFNVPSATALTVWNRLRASATHLDPAAANLGAGSSNLFLYIGGVNFKTQPQSSSINTGAATLSSEAVGTGLSYQLYKGHSGDATYPVGNPQSSGTFTFLPSATQTYWIRATRTCPADGTTVTGDSAEATILLTPVVSAIATNTSTIAVSWIPDGSTATTYELFRASAGSPFNFSSPIFSGTAIQFTDGSRTQNQTYVYKVRATNGEASVFSLPDYATTIAFTDSDLSISPKVKAVHVTELRRAVNLIAEAMGIADPYSQVDLNAPSVGQAIAAAHFTDVMTRLNAVRANPAYQQPPQQLPALSFTSAPAPGGPIKKSQLIDLRSAVN